MEWAICRPAWAPTVLATITRLGEALVVERASTDGGEGDARRSGCGWFDGESAAHQSIFERMETVLRGVNEDLFGFTLTSLEPIQYTIYGHGDYYGWHMDRRDPRIAGDGATRKLSCSLLLNDDFAGGTFEVMVGRTPQIVPLTAGEVVIFPSWLLHQVTPVTEGVRRSLVVWAQGPPWR